MSIEVDIELPTLKELKVAFRMLPNNIAAKHMAAALGRAITPAYKRLRKNTPKGPSGNLRRAVSKKTKKYTKSGAGVALIGYRKPPRGTAVEDRKDNELGYHAHLVEKGTKHRTTKDKVRLASSWNDRGPFQVVRYKSKAKRNIIRTSPKPPKAFLKGTFADRSVDLGKMPAGGKSGKPPLQTTFRETKAELEREIKLQMSAGVEKALMEMAGKFRTTGKR
jgi:hypothetical protein